ncbi:hypothetical protein IGI04_016599 [Brassica rapa subsp. trilocularis]|uniref:Nucleotide-diphospho-sugar transferase domain-containing protein n=2 Tax=Brassica campestris TaxID=3711 RepID=M4DZJ9_BRACM|nr:hypothetical protein IGI04_016599 [Brassica rapa subsp. trilocularis]
MMWRRLEFLGSILELGYNFLFTDMDIMWLRDPFPHLFSEVDFQVTCDHSNGNTSDPGNLVNADFKFVQANRQTVKLNKYWYELRWTFLRQERARRVQHHQTRPVCHRRTRSHDAVS